MGMVGKIFIGCFFLASFVGIYGIIRAGNKSQSAPTQEVLQSQWMGTEKYFSNIFEKKMSTYDFRQTYSNNNEKVFEVEISSVKHGVLGKASVILMLGKNNKVRMRTSFVPSAGLSVALQGDREDVAGEIMQAYIAPIISLPGKFVSDQEIAEIEIFLKKTFSSEDLQQQIGYHKIVSKSSNTEWAYDFETYLHN